MLVCAPTGAGKTNIAMLSVLREVGANRQYGVIQRNNFKVGAGGGGGTGIIPLETFLHYFWALRRGE